MGNKLILSGFLCSLLLLSAVVSSLPVFAQGSDSAGKPHVEYAFGKIPGKDIIVHVAVAVPPGLDKNEVIDNALKYQGAKKITKSEFSLIGGLDWSKFTGDNTITIKYNPANEKADAYGLLQNAMGTWNSADADFTFLSGTTNICPSLVKECGGYVDNEFGFGWVEIKQPQTLGVTYYDTSAGHIDLALTTNKRTTWNTNGANYDVETVVLHELGHALGLAHTDVRAAVMYPSYHGEMRYLHPDDECGIKELYGTPCDPVNDNPPPEPTSCSTPTSTTLHVDLSMNTQTKGKWTDLLIPVSVTDNGNPASGICVDLDLSRDGASWDLLGTTDESGNVVFKLSKARDVVYTATIVNTEHFVEITPPSASVSCLNDGGSLSGNECVTP